MEQVLTKDLREKLKGILARELDNLPETLESMEPKERINVVCRLMPFVFPKVMSVSSTTNEPFQFD